MVSHRIQTNLMRVFSSAMEAIFGVADSSVMVVLSDDLLCEILLRLPVASLLRFIFVSKHWLSLIKSPYFITLYRNQNPNIEPPSGFFLVQNPRVVYDFVQLDSANRPLNTAFPFGPGNVEILHSCNGLLLCIIRPHQLYVYNPSTNHFKMIPDEHWLELDRHEFIGAKLAFDPTKSSYYKLIYARRMYDTHDYDQSIQILTYSSETRNWRVYSMRFFTICFSEFNNGIYWNGAIHWLHAQNEALHYKLDVNHLVLTTILKPATLDDNLHIALDRKLFESRGCLLLVCVIYTYSTKSLQLIVYEMRNECSYWSVKYVIDIYDIISLFPKPWEINPIRWDIVRCTLLGERDQDSFVVLEIYGTILRYNVVLKTLSKIYDFSSPVRGVYYRIHCFPFIPSFDGV